MCSFFSFFSYDDVSYGTLVSNAYVVPSNAGVACQGSPGLDVVDRRNLTGKKKQSISCRLMNAQSIRRKFNELETEIMVDGEFPDVIFITETWLSDEVPVSLFPFSDMYQVIRKDRNLNGGGVAILLRKHLKCTVLTSHVFNGIEVVAARVKFASGDCIVACMYKPSVRDTDLFDPLVGVLEYFESFSIPVVFVGDFNLPGIEWTSAVPTASSAFRQQDFLDLFNSFGLFQHVDRPTTQYGSLLDLVFTNEPRLVYNVEVGEPLGKSDHFVIAFDLDMQNFECPSKKEKLVKSRLAKHGCYSGGN
jgi:hypothetical protein